MTQSIENDQIKVLMVGESLDMQGGIASLQKLILSNLSHRFNFKHLPTIQTSQAGFDLSKTVYFLMALRSLVTILWGDDVDLLHVHVAERGAVLRKMLVIFIASLFQKPVVLHTHGAEFQQFFDGLNPSLQTSVVWAFKKCIFVIVGSCSWRDFYVNHMNLPSHSVRVNPNPVKIPQHVNPPQSIKPEGQKLKIVFLGRIGVRKGTFDLIQAFAKLDEGLRKDCCLVLAGDGDLKSAQDLIRELSLDDSTEILGWINGEQRDQLLSSSDIFVLPTYNEILPLALLEAMSWALPVISTPVNGIPEVVIHEKTGLLVEPGNVSELSDALAKLIREQPFRASLGHAAREKIKPLGVEFYCDKLADIYRAVLMHEKQDDGLRVN